MADIFLSYAKEDREVAGKIATLLGNAGWVVWWDRRIPAGRTWRSVLEEALRDMRCMVVLWSTHSVESDWVRDEADEARIRKKLVPVLIEAVNPPVGFRTIQAADLSDWDGSNSAPGFQQLLADLESLVGKPAPKTSEASRETPRTGEGVKVGPALAEWIKGALKLGVKLKTNWKAAAASGLGIVLLVGVVMLWPNLEPELHQPTTENAESAKVASAPQLMNLAVNGERKEIKANETLRLAVHGNYSDGTQNEINGAEWGSSDPRVASVDAQGQVKALQAGTTKITARYGGVASPAWTLVITAPEIAKPLVPTKLVGL